MTPLFGPKSAKLPPPDPHLPRLQVARAMREDRGRFAAVRGQRVLIYWPHGLGDWTHLGAILPLFEPSNAYAIARFGDDYSSIMEGNRIATALYSGVRAPSDGAARGAAHLGLDAAALNGGPATMVLPPPLDASIAGFAPEALLWTDYPETEGRTAFPYHTKARNLARLVVSAQRLARFDLSQPLRTTIDFSVPVQVQRAVDERLVRLVQSTDRLCVVSRAGVTAARKNWGDASQPRAFAHALAHEDRRWRFISMDEEDLGDRSAGFRALFADLDEPFARVYKAVIARSNLFIGVPAGPLHMTMAQGNVPTVGLWLSHHPDWYDEPNPNAIHLVGRYVRERKFHLRPATTTKPASLQHRLEYLDTTAIDADRVLEAARAVI